MAVGTPICEFGWVAPDFSLRDPHGQVFQKNKLSGSNGLLIAFICNHCPYVKAIGDRLVQDAAELSELGINVVTINSNDYEQYPADSPENMVRFAAHYGFTFPYLIDKDQSVAKTYGAVCTPDFFGLNAAGELQYRGRLDNLRPGDSGTRSPELLSAMRLIAETRRGPTEQIPSMGCSIKWRVS